MMTHAQIELLRHAGATFTLKPEGLVLGPPEIFDHPAFKEVDESHQEWTKYTIEHPINEKKVADFHQGKAAAHEGYGLSPDAADFWATAEGLIHYLHDYYPMILAEYKAIVKRQYSQTQ